MVWVLWLIGMAVGSRWNVFAEGWFMSVTMAAGSFIAGATSEGGGAVAFPVMTLVFGIDPGDARSFSLLIQSVGMTAAAATIYLNRIPFVRSVILPLSVAGACGMLVGTLFVAPHVAPMIAKITFTSLWLAFAVALVVIHRSRGGSGIDALPPEQARSPLLLTVAFLGGILGAITGSGIDICVFSVLVLRCGVSVKVATPTSVILMGLNAVVGALCVTQFYGVSDQVWTWWWCCVPVCALGAPLGAWFISDKAQSFIVRLLIGSIVVQFIGALVILPLQPWHYGFSAAVFAVGIALFGVAARPAKRRRDAP